MIFSVSLGLTLNLRLSPCFFRFLSFLAAENILFSLAKQDLLSHSVQSCGEKDSRGSCSSLSFLSILRHRAL